jgi:hypothetical protein
MTVDDYITGMLLLAVALFVLIGAGGQIIRVIRIRRLERLLRERSRRAEHEESAGKEE